METAEFNFDPIKRGDTFPEHVLRVNFDGQPADLTNAQLKMHVKYSPNSPIMKDLEPYVSGEGQITIPSFNVELQPGTYLYDLEITLRDGFRHTYIEGKFPVEKDISR